MFTFANTLSKYQKDFAEQKNDIELFYLFFSAPVYVSVLDYWKSVFWLQRISTTKYSKDFLIHLRRVNMTF